MPGSECWPLPPPEKPNVRCSWIRSRGEHRTKLVAVDEKPVGSELADLSRHHFNRHADLDLLRIDIRQLGRDADALFQLDHCQQIRGGESLRSVSDLRMGVDFPPSAESERAQLAR